MTRKTWLKGLITLWPLALLGAKKPEKVCFPVRDIWQTPQGQYVLALREELKRLDHWDDLEEDWAEVENALKNGHMFFDVRVSRQGKNPHRAYYCICPLTYSSTSQSVTVPDSDDWKVVDYQYLQISRITSQSSRPRL